MTITSNINRAVGAIYAIAQGVKHARDAALGLFFGRVCTRRAADAGGAQAPTFWIETDTKMTHVSDRAVRRIIGGGDGLRGGCASIGRDWKIESVDGNQAVAEEALPFAEEVDEDVEAARLVKEAPTAAVVPQSASRLATVLSERDQQLLTYVQQAKGRAQKKIYTDELFWVCGLQQKKLAKITQMATQVKHAFQSLEEKRREFSDLPNKKIINEINAIEDQVQTLDVSRSVAGGAFFNNQSFDSISENSEYLFREIISKIEYIENEIIAGKAGVTSSEGLQPRNDPFPGRKEALKAGKGYYYGAELRAYMADW